jgi:hypothetical protein
MWMRHVSSSQFQPPPYDHGSVNYVPRPPIARRQAHETRCIYNVSRAHIATAVRHMRCTPPTPKMCQHNTTPKRTTHVPLMQHRTTAHLARVNVYALHAQPPHSGDHLWTTCTPHPASRLSILRYFSSISESTPALLQQLISLLQAHHGEPSRRTTPGIPDLGDVNNVALPMTIWSAHTNGLTTCQVRSFFHLISTFRGSTH